MEEVINIAIEKYCKSLANRYKIKDVERIRTIVEKTLYSYDFDKLGYNLKLWIKDKISIEASESFLNTIKHLDPISIEILKNNQELLKDKIKLSNFFERSFKFRPSLEEALNYLIPEEAFNLFEKTNLEFLSRKEAFVKEITHNFSPFLTLEELAKELEAFISHLNSNKEFIIKTGHPGEVLYRQKLVQLDRLSRCYYIHCPKRVEFTFHLPLVHGSKCWISFSNSLFWDLLSKLPFEVSPTSNISLLKYIWKDGSYEKAPIIDGLPLTEVKHLNEIREKFFRIKLQILDTISYFLKENDAYNLHKNCLDVFVNKMSIEDFKFFFEMDEFYTFEEKKEREVMIGCNGVITPCRSFGPVYISGGIIDIIFVIEYFEREIRIGKLSKTKALLNNISEDRYLTSYYQKLSQNSQRILESAFETYLELTDKENESNKTNEIYMELLDRFAKHSRRGEKNNLVKTLNNYPQLKKHLEIIKTYQGEEFTFNLEIARKEKPSVKQMKKSIKPFSTPQGITWYDISIYFISSEEVEVRAGNTPLGVKNFINFGCSNGRIKDSVKTKPTLSWHALKAFGKCQGEISWEDKKGVEEKTRNSLKSSVKDLRRRLKFLFRIEDDPFYPYDRKTKAYKVKFNISVREDDQY